MRSALTISLLVAALALVIRLPGLGHVMTVDEQNWMLRSADFYHELLAGNPGGTFLTTHPGSVAMWLIGGGETLWEARLGFAVDTSTTASFRLAAIYPLMLFSCAIISLIVWLLSRLLGTAAAVTAGILLAAEPYVVGMTQIAHLDAAQGLLMLASLLAFLSASTFPIRRVFPLVLSGILFGLALGFKAILAAWLLPVFVLITLTRAVRIQTKPIVASTRSLGLVIGVAALVFWLSWPALWVKDDLGRSLVRDYSRVVTDEHVLLEAADEPIAPVTFYLRFLLGRLTPQTQILAVGAVAWLGFLTVKRRRGTEKFSSIDQGHSISWLLLYAIGFLVLITLAAKKADRYALPAFVVWPVVAGWVAATAESLARERVAVWARWHRWGISIMLIAVIALPVLWSPWAMAYNNPVWPDVRPLSQQGWGEGLEAAAAWLNGQPHAADMYIASWYPSVMQTFFVGKTMSLSSRDDYRVQYLVLYRNMGGRGLDTQASAVLAEMRNRAPVHTVTIQGVPYVWIYATRSVGSFPRTIGEIEGPRTVGQTVVPSQAGWSWIDIGFATYSSRNNTEDVIVHVRRSPQATQDIRTVAIRASALVDNEWQRFTWEPIADSAGQQFYVLIDSPASTPGNAVTVRYTDDDSAPGTLYLNGQMKPGDSAYRIQE